MIGYVPYGPSEVLWGLAGLGDPVVAAIVREVRLPRTLLALEVGAALGLAGAALQGLLRNPLAEPGLIGVSSSAALGAVIAFHFGLMTLASWALPVTAIAGASVTTVTLLLIGRWLPGTLPLILTGIALSSLAGAMTSLALNLAPNPYALNEMVLWLMGSLKDRSMDEVLLALPFLIGGGSLLLSGARGLDALTLGEEAARGLGVNLARLRATIVIGIALVVGAAVSVSGAIGFVGLVVPHMLRPFVGHQPRRQLLPSALGGAALVTVADTVARVLPTHQEVMVGVVTALLGAPFFLFLVLRTRRIVP
jgi:iron complex transport system permease protein